MTGVRSVPRSPSLALGMVRLGPDVLQEAFNVLRERACCNRAFTRDFLSGICWIAY